MHLRRGCTASANCSPTRTRSPRGRCSAAWRSSCTASLSVSASRSGGLLARVRPADTDACPRPHTALMEMRGRAIDGWIIVAPEGLRTKRQLAAWVQRSLTFVREPPAEVSDGDPGIAA